MAIAVGVDIGGTKIAAGLVDAAGKVIARAELPAPSTARGIEQTATQMVDRLVTAAPDLSIEAIGIGCPGTIDPFTGEVTASDSKPGLVGANVGDVLGQKFGAPYAVTNDVNAAGVGELAYGAASGFSRVLVVSAGTGIGGAILLGGRLEEGMSGTAGEIAHLLIPQPAAGRCGCGKTDHLEAAASGPGIEAAYAAASSQRTGDAASARQVAAYADSGDELARTVIDQAGQILGRCVAGLANAIDIDALVLTGGLAEIDRYVAAVRAAFADEVMVPLRAVPVLKGALGTDAPIVGAATYVRARLGI